MISDQNENIRSELFKKAIHLKKIYRERGYFIPSKSRITIEITIVFLTLVSAFSLLSTQTLFAYLTSPFLFGIYLQQSAYIGHELGHVKYFKSSGLQNYIGSVIGVFQGLSFSWWNHEHNQHHYHLNEYEVVDAAPIPIDHSIEGAPLIVWDWDLITAEQRRKYGWWIKLQPWMIWPVMSLARINWIFKGLSFSFTKRNWLEFFGIIAHLVTVPALAYWLTDSIQMTCVWVIAGNLIGSFIFTTAFLANHTCTEVRTKDSEQDYFIKQVRSTRNLTQSPFMNWFTGRLNLQIEHHFYPQIPMYVLPLIAADVREIIESSGLKYDKQSYFGALKTIFKEIPR